MGKIRIKQVSTGLEELNKGKEKGVIQEKKKVATKKKAKAEPKPADRKRTHPRQQYGRSKRYNKLTKSKKVAKSLKEAVVFAQQTATANFDESIEVHINVSKTGIRTTATLPYSTGKKHRVLILTSNPKAIGSLASYKEILTIAGPKKLEEIKKSGSAPDIDEIWATPDIMKNVSSIARILGPAGIMPNPKRGTIVKPGKIAEKIKSLTSGGITLETERKAPVIHTVLGKANMKETHLTSNLKAIISAIDPKNIKGITLSSTMGPGIKIYL